MLISKSTSLSVFLAAALVLSASGSVSAALVASYDFEADTPANPVYPQDSSGNDRHFASSGPVHPVQVGWDGGPGHETAIDWEDGDPDDNPRKAPMDFGNQSWADPGTDDFSVYLWYWQDSTQDFQYILQKGNDDSSNESGFAMSGYQGTPLLRVGPTTTQAKWQIISDTTVGTDTWAQFVIVFNRSGDEHTAKIFVNGVETASQPLDPAADIFSGEYMRIGGRRAGGSEDFEGKVDDVAIYSRALTPEEIATAYDNGGGFVADDTALEAKWDFSELPKELPTGVTKDTSGNERHGVNYWSELVVDPERGNVAEFDGATARISLTEHLDDITALTQGTTAAWIKTTKTGRGVIFGASDTTQGSREINFFVEGGGGTLKFISRGGNNNGAGLTFGSVSDDQWHHVAVTHDGDIGTMYIDGSFVASTVTGWFNDFGGNLNYMAIGNNIDSGGPQWFFDGLIDDLQIYDTPLSAAEIADLYPSIEVSTTDLEFGTTDAEPSMVNASLSPAAPAGGLDMTVDYDDTIIGVFADVDGTQEIPAGSAVAFSEGEDSKDLYVFPIADGQTSLDLSIPDFKKGSVAVTVIRELLLSPTNDLFDVGDDGPHSLTIDAQVPAPAEGRQITFEYDDTVVELFADSDATEPIASGASVSLPADETAIDVYAVPDMAGGSLMQVTTPGYAPALATYNVVREAPSLPAAGNLLVWLKSDEGLVADGGGKIEMWADRAPLGGAENFLQGNEDAQPTVVPGGAAGMPTVGFDGDDVLHLEPDADLENNQFTWFAVFKLTDVPQTYPTILSSGYGDIDPGPDVRPDDALWRTYWRSNDDNYHSYTRTAGGSYRGAASEQTTIGSWAMLSARWDGATIAQWVNGVAGTPATGADADPSDHRGSTIGAMNTAEFIKGEMAEIVIYNAALSDEDRQAVQAYLNEKWMPRVTLDPASDLFAAGDTDPHSLSVTLDPPASAEGLDVTLAYDESVIGISTDLEGNTPIPSGSAVSFSEDETTIEVFVAPVGPGYTVVTAEAPNRTAGQATIGVAEDYPELPADNNLVVWLKADEGVTEDGNGNVQRWIDQAPIIGGPNDAVNDNDDQRPTLTPDAISGLPALAFDGDNEGHDILMTDYTPPPNDELTVFVVARQSGTAYSGGSRLKLLLVAGSPAYYHNVIAINNDGGNIHKVEFGSEGTGEWGVTVTESFADGAAHIIAGQIAGELGGRTLSAYYDGASVQSDVPLADDPVTGPFEIGGSSTSANRRFAGSIAEVIIYNTALSEADVQAVNSYLADRWVNSIALSPGEGEFILPDQASDELELTVSIDAPAPEGGTEIALDYNPEVIALSSDVAVIPQDATETQVTVTPVDIGETAVEASSEGYMTGRATFYVKGGITLTPTSDTLTENKIDELTIELSVDAPSGGVLVDLSIGDPLVLDVQPGEAVVPEGESQAIVDVLALAEGSTTVTASAPNFVAGQATYQVTKAAEVPGDVDGDGCVNVADLLTVRNNLGQTGSDIFPRASDVSPEEPDGVVNVADLLFVRNRLGDGTCE